jgi:hypothetical protein
MKIYFFTGKVEHSTNIEIITQLKENAEKDAIEYELVNLQSLNIEQLREILILSAENAQNTDILFLLKPDHPNSYEVCKFALDHNINTINNASSTLKLINRWQIENELKIFLEEMKEVQNKIDDSAPLLIDIPKTWFIVTEVDFREEEQEGWILSTGISSCYKISN